MGKPHPPAPRPQGEGRTLTSKVLVGWGEGLTMVTLRGVFAQLGAASFACSEWARAMSFW